MQWSMEYWHVKQIIHWSIEYCIVNLKLSGRIVESLTVPKIIRILNTQFLLFCKIKLLIIINLWSVYGPWLRLCQQGPYIVYLVLNIWLIELIDWLLNWLTLPHTEFDWDYLQGLHGPWSTSQCVHSAPKMTMTANASKHLIMTRGGWQYITFESRNFIEKKYTFLFFPPLASIRFLDEKRHE